MKCPRIGSSETEKDVTMQAYMPHTHVPDVASLMPHHALFQQSSAPTAVSTQRSLSSFMPHVVACADLSAYMPHHFLVLAKEDVLADDGKATVAENPTASIAKPLTIESVSIAQTEESSSFLTVISLKMRLFGKLLAARLACV